MAQQVNNFARFYSALNEIPYTGDREVLKCDLIREYTLGRTCSLREMTREEYNSCCDALEKITGKKEKLKKRRSECLKLMQKLGIDTTDWTRINNFCRHPRIAGKEFARISIEGLERLSKKLRAIQRNGGLKQQKDNHQPGKIVYAFRLDSDTLKS